VEKPQASATKGTQPRKKITSAGENRRAVPGKNYKRRETSGVYKRVYGSAAPHCEPVLNAVLRRMRVFNSLLGDFIEFVATPAAHRKHDVRQQIIDSRLCFQFYRVFDQFWC
jgi:hypothetical protein